MFQAQALRLTLMTFGRKKETCLIHCNENTAILKIAFKGVCSPYSDWNYFKMTKQARFIYT